MLPLSHLLHDAVARLLQSSEYVVRRTRHLQNLLETDDCQRPLDNIEYARLVAVISFDKSLDDFSEALRAFRHRYLLRLAVRELALLQTTEETMRSWSLCAEALILHAIGYAIYHHTKRFGEPAQASGEPVYLHTIALGKLGGSELNFSSDVDLMFCYSAVGQSTGNNSLSNEEYFTKVVQQVMHLLHAITGEGFVFRVDLRLRPHGEGGPLVCTVAAMETYYQEQGRDWERYALVKARLLGKPARWFHRLIIPFVYRRYLDFSVIESLRSMKALIEREIQANPMLDDIKRGRGGIREVEFIIQCFQLIRGGRLLTLQQSNAMQALEALKHAGLLKDTDLLREAYLFLRRLENALQLQQDQQTHTLPPDPKTQASLVLMLGCCDWDELMTQIYHYQTQIRHAFDAMLRDPLPHQDEKRLLDHQLTSLWQGHLEQGMAIHLLTSLSYQSPERCYQLLTDFHHAPRCRRLTQSARLRLDKFMILLLTELPRVKETDRVLLQILRLLDNLVGRSAYLALLTENAMALPTLLDWSSHSPFMMSLLIEHPFLLEVLIEESTTWKPPSHKELAALLQKRMQEASDEEAEDLQLRQFKLTAWLMAARAQLYDYCDAVQIARFLSDLASVIITAVLERACRQLRDRDPHIDALKAHFAIIAYGKLGSKDMSYDSDLDLVFLHSASPEEESLLTRLTQKMLHLLTTRGQMGILYTVDTRLRPSGSAGLLVSRMDAFMAYQRQHAWTWEHQALLRARVLCGSASSRRSFLALKRDIVCLPRAEAALSEAVQIMREKMGYSDDFHDIKFAAGGLVDLEFLIQFLILAHPQPEFARYTNLLAQIRALEAATILSEEQVILFTRAYRHYHQILHYQILLEQRG